MAKIRPLGDRILAKVLEAKAEKVGSIYVPDTAKEKPQEAEVIAVGTGKWENDKKVPLDVQVGDKILYGKYSGTEVKIDNEEFLILKESDILAVVE